MVRFRPSQQGTIASLASTSSSKLSDFDPLVKALKQLFSATVDLAKAAVEVVIQLFQLIIEFVKAGFSLLP